MKTTPERQLAGLSRPAERSGALFNTDIYTAFTLKKTGKQYPYSHEYENYIDWMNKQGVTVQCYYYELDSERRLHVHGTFTAPKRFYKKKLVKRWWHLKMVEIPSHEDLYNWANYITKHYDNEYEEEQMCDINDIHVSPYPFI